MVLSPFLYRNVILVVLGARDNRPHCRSSLHATRVIWLLPPARLGPTLEDYLVLYTDGVTEARRGGELFGEQRLLEVVGGLRGRSAQELAEGVRDAVLDFAGRLRDDLQAVVLRLARSQTARDRQEVARADCSVGGRASRPDRIHAY